MVKFISVAVVALMVSSAAVPAFAKEKQHGKGGGAHGISGLSKIFGGKGGKGLGGVAGILGATLGAIVK